MRWDQIESKWAVMTRRIRADWGDNRSVPCDVSVRNIKRREAPKPGVAESQTIAVSDSELQTSAK